MIVLALGGGGIFVGVTTAANAGVPADKAGLAAALLNASQQLGGALGLQPSPRLRRAGPTTCSPPARRCRMRSRPASSAH
jgi:hypothetical protein